jgi:hypothetical protein
MRRTIFYVSDGTGITAETIGHSVLTQFDELEFDTYRLPFVDDEEKAHGSAARIRNAYATTGARPIVVNTVVDPLLARSWRPAGTDDRRVRAVHPAARAELGVKRKPKVGKARLTGLCRVRSAHQCDQLRAEPRRRRRRQLQRCREHHHRRVARGQDAKLPVHSAAL